MTNCINSQRQVVVIGGGFGGLEAVKRLRRANVQVTLIDRHNYHLFQPLLYQVATGGLSPSNIATPLRFVLRKQANCQVLLAGVQDIEVANRRVILADGHIEFDYLVVAAGATHSYFGNDQWKTLAPGLKSIADATNIRRRIFIAFEAAERESDPKVRRGLMTFVIVGGGPTGVELAGALSEIAKHTLKHDFRHINPAEARIIIVEAAEHVLSHYPAELSQRAAEKIRSLGVELLTQTKVTDIEESRVLLTSQAGESTIATQTVLWAAGVQANPLGRVVANQCGVEPDHAGRVPVNSQLTVGSCGYVYVIGDLASCRGEDGRPLPGIAPVAMQQGAFVAKRIALQTMQSSGVVSQSSIEEPFRYRDRGTMATIGRAAAVAQIGNRQYCGFFAWILWLMVHLMQILQFENRVLVLLQWSWNYITFNRSSRIITGEEPLILVQKRQDE